LNYGGRTEGIKASPRLCSENIKKRRNPQEKEEKTIAPHLFTAEVPDSDPLIRTRGEKRVSNFFLWQIAYTEIYVTETLWPDFRRADLFEAIIEFQKRERRFGGIKPVEHSSPAARIAK